MLFEVWPPYEKWYVNKASIFHFKNCGSSEWAHIPSEKKNKPKPKKHHYILVGYNKVSKAYSLYDPSTHKVIEHRDVILDEVPTHYPLGSFPLSITNDPIDDSQCDSMALSPSHYISGPPLKHECFLKHSSYSDYKQMKIRRTLCFIHPAPILQKSLLY